MTKHKHPTNVIAICEKLLKTYNPVTHSIDTHCLEQLGDVTKPDADPQNVLIQQIVYGCHKEKPILKVRFFAANESYQQFNNPMDGNAEIH